MGYSVNYYGSIDIEPPLDSELHERINAWLACHHAQYDVDKIYQVDPDADLHTVDGNPVGENGWNWVKVFIDPHSPAYEPYLPAVIDERHSDPMPSLWSDLILEHDYKMGSAVLKWNGIEKSYEIPSWIEILIQNVLAPNGYVLNGVLSWEGDDNDDTGSIRVVDNDVIVDYC